MKCDPAPGPSSSVQIPVSTPMSFSGSFVNVRRSSSATSVVGRSSPVTGAKFIGTSKEPSRSSPSTLRTRIQPNSGEVSEEDVIQLSPILFDELVHGGPKTTSETQTVTVEMKSVSAATDVTITNLYATPPAEMISQTTETDRMIMKLPPTAVEVKNQDSEIDRMITKLPPTAVEVKNQDLETDRMITKLPPTAVEVKNQDSETDRMITKLPPTAVEVKNQASETDSRITNIPASNPEMKLAYTETDIAITQSP